MVWVVHVWEDMIIVWVVYVRARTESGAEAG